MISTERIGVILFNLGGPERLDEVRPFLYNLFSDPEIIRLPIRALQKPLAWMIARFRANHSKHYYELIGGGSPLRRITDEQAAALERELSKQLPPGVSVKVYVGMRYWHPMTETAVRRIVDDGVTRLVVLPLYPQFSVSTTGSSIKAMIRELERLGGRREIRRHYITRWFDNEEYLDALTRKIAAQIEQLPDQTPRNVHVLFSAHSIPLSYVERGDPYERHTRQTVWSVMQKLGNLYPHHLSFQSKVGPVKWLEPSTDQMIRRLAREGVRQLVLVPVSFVSEHVETLYELDILYREVAGEAGIKELRRVPTLDADPPFIRALANMVTARLQA